MAVSVDTLREQAREFAQSARELAREAEALAQRMGELPANLEAAAPDAAAVAHAGHGQELVIALTVFVLAVFVGYHVVWRVTPALHSPLISVTNAVSSVIVVGALIAAGPADYSLSMILGLIGVLLASVNIFGGFIVTQRMLGMFMQKKK